MDAIPVRRSPRDHKREAENKQTTQKGKRKRKAETPADVSEGKAGPADPPPGNKAQKRPRKAHT